MSFNPVLTGAAQRPSPQALAQTLEQVLGSKAKRITADAEAYATGVIAGAITANGLEAAQYQIAMKQVEALAQVALGEGKQTILLPANALEAFSDAFKLVRGKG